MSTAIVVTVTCPASAYYCEAFEGVIGNEWSSQTTSLTPVGARRFLGEFGNETVSLTLTNLPAHTNVTLCFDLLLLRSWDGNHATYGPDVWDLTVGGGPVLAHTTFSVGPDQAYPDDFPLGSHPARAGSMETNTLGYSFYYNGTNLPADSVYRMSYTFAHSSAELALAFSATNLQQLADESWGLDNVVLNLTALSANYALRFDGDDVVTVSNTASLNPSEITVETWVKFDQLESAQFLVCKGGDRTSGAYALAFVPGYEFLFEIGMGQSVNTSAPVETNRWYHLAGTYDGQTLRLYVDGVLQATNSIGSVPVGNSSPLYLSYNDVSGFPYYLTGELDAVRIWGHARSEAEIRGAMCIALTGSEPGLAGCWDLNEDQTSQMIYDRSAHGARGVLGDSLAQEQSDPARILSTVPCATILFPPAIGEQPQSRTNVLGSTATFSVTATGTAPLSYQWRKDNVNLEGMTNASLVLTNVQMSQEGEYRVVVTNSHGSVTSAPASLTVLALPVTSDVALCQIGKGRVFVQTNANGPVLHPAMPYEFRSYVYPAASNSILSVVAVTPLGDTNAMFWSSFFGAFATEAAKATEAELDASFPTGTYTATITTAHEGVRIAALNLPPGGYPNAPNIQNWLAAQSVDPGADFTVTWDAFVGGRSNDFIRLYVADTDGNQLFSTPGTPGLPGSLDGLSTSTVIPGNTLPPQQSFLGILAFYRIVAVDSNACPGAVSISAYDADTRFPIKSVSVGACTNAPAGLIGWWPGDAMGTDLVGGRTAAFRGGATNGGGFVAEAFVLDGTNSFMEVADAPALNFGTNDFTVALWVNFESTSGEQVLAEKYIETMQNNGPGWGLTKLADNSLIFGTRGLPLVHTAPSATTTNTWMQIVARRGGGTGNIFTNGALAATGSFSYDVDSASSLKFGHRGNPTDTPGSLDTRGFFLNGRLDEVAIFGRALSDEEIAAIHAIGSAGMCGAGWRFVSAQVTNQLFTANLAGWPSQSTLDIESSTNLTHWQWLQTRTSTNGLLWFTHPTATNGPVRFYRAVVR
jgi:hypothetical protein